MLWHMERRDILSMDVFALDVINKLWIKMALVPINNQNWDGSSLNMRKEINMIEVCQDVHQNVTCDSDAVGERQSTVLPLYVHVGPPG